MALNFPNRSRSYDPGREAIRFWGHDSALEVAFLLERDALFHIAGNAPKNEASFLHAFDANRESILAVARKAYTRPGNGFYVLVASDF
jgi:hypothetical protein